MIESDRYWPALCAALGRPELEGDPRFVDARARYRRSAELVAILDEVFRGQSLEAWERILAGQPLIWAPVRTLEEAIHDPQARANGVFAEPEHPVAGRFGTVAPPLRLSGYPMPGDALAPELGADSLAVLREAGLDEESARAALGSEEPGDAG